MIIMRPLTKPVPSMCLPMSIPAGRPRPRRRLRSGRHPTPQERPGGHAFIIVGYNSLGFIVQNSWGPEWGTNGFALWLYEDWVSNISDGWVFRLAIPTPQIFGITARSQAKSEAEIAESAPKGLRSPVTLSTSMTANLKGRAITGVRFQTFRTAERIKDLSANEATPICSSMPTGG